MLPFESSLLEALVDIGWWPPHPKSFTLSVSFSVS
jgi:hypothetical protein